MKSQAQERLDLLPETRLPSGRSKTRTQVVYFLGFCCLLQKAPSETTRAALSSPQLFLFHPALELLRAQEPSLGGPLVPTNQYLRNIIISRIQRYSL